jgi:alcohol dehydrogenase (cytochrome c)
MLSPAGSFAITVMDAERPAFTARQAEDGGTVYQAQCAACHGAALAGGAGPNLSGANFLRRWGSGARSVGDLYDLIARSMPKQSPASLPADQYAEVTAYILYRNGYQPGEIALSPAVMKIKLVADSAVRRVADTPEDEEPKPASFPGPAKIAGKARGDRPTDAELVANADRDWLMYNKGYAGQRYSGLGQINLATAPSLAPVCVFQSGEIGNFETAPAIYDGTMYITTPWTTYAVTAADCRLLWRMNYKGSTSAPMSLTRGVALYRGKVFRGTPNGHLIALDAATGELLWDVWMSDPDRGYWLSAAPIAFDGRVFMGEAGADWGADGHVLAFDAESGKHLWTFDLIPTGKQTGAKTWKKGTDHGGGSIWSTFSLIPDEDGGVLFASTGNPAPDFNEALRPGDNLFTDSVVALHASSGQLAWYVQQVPHDTRDWDTAAAPVLYEKGGGDYMAVVNKGGWLYRYDRRTHKLLGKSEISTHLNDTAPITKTPLRICPGNIGGAAWNGPAFAAKDGILLTNSIEWCGEEKLTESRFLENTAYFGGSFTFDDAKDAHGWIRGFSADTGKELWKRLTDQPMVAGITATAGGVAFTGNAAGEMLVLDVKTGATLYTFRMGGPVAGAPSTYLVGDRQYVAVPSSGGTTRSPWGGNGAASIFVFALR